jgi:hypothetical protein
MSLQSRLTSIHGYIGARPNQDRGGIWLHWAVGEPRTNEIVDAIRLIEQAGYTAIHCIGGPEMSLLKAESRRLIVEHRGPTPVVATGPDAHHLRINIRVATGSFIAAYSRGLDVLFELMPRVPVAILEAARPVPAADGT